MKDKELDAQSLKIWARYLCDQAAAQASPQTLAIVFSAIGPLPHTDIQYSNETDSDKDTHPT